MSGSRSKVRVKFIGQGQISGVQRSILDARLCRVQQRAIRVIAILRCLCVSNQWAYADNRADAVDQLLILLESWAGRITYGTR